MPLLALGQANPVVFNKGAVNWYFGNTGKALRFGRLDAKAAVVNDKLPSFGTAGAGTVSNPVTGNLLFYTDGAQVVDVLGNPMPNGSGLSGNPSANQPVAVCPVPGQPGKYFIFTNSASVTSPGAVSFSVVDMALPGNGIAPAPGLGDVEPGKKNIGVSGLTGVSEAMILVPHSNGTDFWLLTQKHFTTTYQSTLVSASAYNGGFPAPLVNTLSNTPSNPGEPLPLVASHFAYNVKNGKIAVACSRPPVISPAPLTDAIVLNFSAAAGVISFNIFLENTAVEGTANQAIYDIEFSPSGKYLYYTVFDNTDPDFPSGLYRLEWNSLDRTPVPVVNSGLSGSFGLQTGPDGSIYHLYNSGGQIRMARITKPEGLQVADIGYESNVFGTWGGTQFPAVPPDSDYGLTVSVDIKGSCVGNPTLFIKNAPVFFLPTVTPGADSLQWEIDAKTISGWSPVVKFSTAGAKSAKVTAWLNGKSRSLTTSVNITDFELTINAPSDTTACRSEFPPPRGTSTPRQFQVTARVQSGGSVNFLWSNGDVGPVLKPAKAGYYWVIATAPNGCTAAAGVNVKEYGTADQRTNLWYFGDKAGIDFSQNPPKATDVSQLNAPEGVAMVGDRNSTALFYTDGDRIFDRNHSLITSGLGGSPNSTQGATIIPIAGDETLFYIFTTEAVELGSGNSLYYSIFDLKLNGGFGGMVDVKRPLFAKTTERSTGTSSLVLTHEYGNNAFRNYQVTQDGLGNPVISVAGSVHSYAVPENAEGYMRIGPKNLLVVPLSTPGTSNVLEVFDLDAGTGKVTNARTVDLNEPSGKVYGVEFALGGDKLFATVLGTPSTIVEYAIDAANAFTLVQKLSNPGRLGAVQLAPDGNIYIASEGATSLISILVNATSTQSSAIDANGFRLAPNTSSRLGLPNFILPTGNSFGGPGISYEGICLGALTEITGIRTDIIDVMTWTIQDMGTFQETLGKYEYEQLKLRFPQAKTYTIGLSIINRCITAPIVISDQIRIVAPPSKPAANGPGICVNPVTIDAGTGGIASPAYLWSTGETTKTISVKEAGSYVVIIRDNVSGCTSRGVINVGDSRPRFDLGPDRSICQDSQPFKLDARNPAAKHTWLVNGVVQSSTSPTFPINDKLPAGTLSPVKTTYTAIVKNNTGSCQRTDDVVITVIPAPLVNLTIVDPNACKTTTGSIDVDIKGPDNSFTYQIISGPVTTSPVNQKPVGNYPINNLASGTYQITVLDEVSQCRLDKQFILKDPAVFTINASGLVTCSPVPIPVSMSLAGNYEVSAIDASGIPSPLTSCIGCTNLNTTAVPPGTYVVEVREKVSGCKVMQSGVALTAGAPVPATLSVNDCLALPEIKATVPGAGVTVAWSGPGTITSPNTPVTTVNPGSVGTFIYDVIVKQAGFCELKSSVTVNYDGAPPSILSTDKCIEPVELRASSISPNYLVQWTRNGFVDPNLIASNITLSSADNGATYSLDWVSVNNGCSGSAGPIVAQVVGKVEATLTSTPACEDNKPVTLSSDVNIGSAVTYQWYFRDPKVTGSGFSLVPGQTSSTLRIEPGTPVEKEGFYQVEIDRSGCKGFATNRVLRAPLPVGELSDYEVICADPSNPDPATNQIELDPGNFLYYEWYKTDPVPPLLSVSRTFVATDKGVYKVRLISTALCENYDQTEVLDDCQPRIVAPNAFRPDSTVPENQKFSLYSLFITNEFRVYIYNRWGEMVFQSDDPDFKWDGTYNNSGQQLPGGTYAWMVRYKRSYNPAGFEERRGGVLLIR